MSEVITRLNSALQGRYVVEREIGEGGMATVYLAEDTKLHRKVALKVLRPELAAVVGGEGFVREIETTAKLQHPNILPLFESGQADGFLFYVMPYVEGESLRDRLAREKQLPVDEAVRIASEVAEALQVAHEHGVVHRDIKPGNIMLSKGRPLVADFGIALAVNAAGGNRLTETGLSVGTPGYMSPEQATGDQAVGPASDLYALGCVLYEMLAGEPPYTGGTVQAILGKIITTPAEPVTTHRNTVPPHVEAVVARALEKLPADRFRSAEAFARALHDEGFRHDPVATRATASTRVPVWAVVGWGVAAVLAGLGFWLASSVRDAPAPEVRRLSLALPDSVRPGWSIAATPDGSALVLAASQGELAASQGDRSSSLLLYRLDDRSRSPIADSEGGQDPVVSPDGASVAFVGREGLRVAPLQGGGSATTLVDGNPQTLCCPRWADDGYVYYAEGGGIQRVHASGGESESVVPDLDTGTPNYFLPIEEGRRAVVGMGFGGPDSVAWMNRETGELRMLAQGFRPTVLEGRHLLYVAEPDRALQAAVIDPATGRFLEGPVVVGEHVGWGRRGAFQQEGGYVLTESGDLAYWRSGDARETLVWVDHDGMELGFPSVDWAPGFISAQVSPDGERIAFSDGAEVWVWDSGTATQRRLTTYGGANTRPVWAPDGRSLSFISDRGGRHAAYSVQVDGVAEPRFLFEHPGKGVYDVTWSEDGAWWIYRTLEPQDIYARGIGSDDTVIEVSADPDAFERSPTLSPDSRWVAYVSDETGSPTVWVRPFPDVDAGRRQVSTGTATEPLWSPDGDELFFRTDQGVVSLPITDPETFTVGPERLLFEDEAYARASSYTRYAFDATSDRFLMVRTLDYAARQAAELILYPNFMAHVKKQLGR